MLIGGLAVQQWGQARLTVDADFTVSVPVEKSDDVIRLITQRYPSRAVNPFEMASKTRMILVTASNGVKVDMSLALPGYEDEVMRRAKEVEVEPGTKLPICSAEDLIIHKAVAGRPQDIIDITTVVERQRQRLDKAYIRKWLSMFAETLENEEVIQRFERAVADPA